MFHYERGGLEALIVFVHMWQCDRQGHYNQKHVLLIYTHNSYLKTTFHVLFDFQFYSLLHVAYCTIHCVRANDYGDSCGWENIDTAEAGVVCTYGRHLSHAIEADHMLAQGTNAIKLHLYISYFITDGRRLRILHTPSSQTHP